MHQIIFSHQILKKHIKMVCCAKYERKTGPYPPLFPNKYPTLPFQPKNIRVVSSFSFTQWMKEKLAC
jgi:hypothetical protein